MVTVRKIFAMNGMFVYVEVSGVKSAEYGPFSEEECDAFIDGCKAFAQPHIVQFIKS